MMHKAPGSLPSTAKRAKTSMKLAEWELLTHTPLSCFFASSHLFIYLFIETKFCSKVQAGTAGVATPGSPVLVSQPLICLFGPIRYLKDLGPFLIGDLYGRVQPTGSSIALGCVRNQAEQSQLAAFTHSLCFSSCLEAPALAPLHAGL